MRRWKYGTKEKRKEKGGRRKQKEEGEIDAVVERVGWQGRVAGCGHCFCS